MKFQRKRWPIKMLKAGPIKKYIFDPSPTVTFLIGPLIESASVLSSRAGEMLQGLYLKVV